MRHGMMHGATLIGAPSGAARQRLTSLRCRLRGHDTVLAYGERSIFLACTSCAYRSPGWVVGPPRYTRCEGAPSARATPYRLAFSVLRPRA